MKKMFTTSMLLKEILNLGFQLVVGAIFVAKSMKKMLKVQRILIHHVHYAILILQTLLVSIVKSKPAIHSWNLEKLTAG